MWESWNRGKDTSSGDSKGFSFSPSIWIIWTLFYRTHTVWTFMQHMTKHLPPVFFHVRLNTGMNLTCNPANRWPSNHQAIVLFEDLKSCNLFTLNWQYWLSEQSLNLGAWTFLTEMHLRGVRWYLSLSSCIHRLVPLTFSVRSRYFPTQLLIFCKADLSWRLSHLTKSCKALTPRHHLWKREHNSIVYWTL